ncbi:uroporphyrin-III C-methyltransferase [Alcanivorax sp. S71-1-4]|nr:uroporphyrin-III C-methyltransferase [Alcanivorax sp. S71-1-4]
MLLLLLILACAFFAWQWWQGLQRHQGDWRAAVAALQHGHEQLAGNMAAEHRATTERMAQMEAELAARETATPVSGEQHWLINEAISLASLAEQQLLLTGDPQAARRLLRAADEVLARSEAPETVRLRAALAADIEKLAAADHVDLVAVMLRLEGLQRQVPELVLPRRERSAAAEQAAPAAAPSATPPSFWERVLSRLPVQVRRHEGAVPLPLDADSRQLLRLNLESVLQEARLALMQGRTALYDAALARADALLAEWFADSDPVVIAFRETLAELRAVPVSRALPDIGDGLAALKQARAGEAQQ